MCVEIEFISLYHLKFRIIFPLSLFHLEGENGGSFLLDFFC